MMISRSVTSLANDGLRQEFSNGGSDISDDDTNHGVPGLRSLSCLMSGTGTMITGHNVLIDMLLLESLNI